MAKSDEQVANTSLILAKPLASEEKLREEYDDANEFLAPMEDSEAIKEIVGI
ncbi:unnamed protein product, partial [marine sediment metagenome]